MTTLAPLSFESMWQPTTDAIGNGTFDPVGANFPNLPQLGSGSSALPSLNLTSQFPSIVDPSSSAAPAASPSSGNTQPNAAVGNQQGSDVASAAAPGSVQNYFMRGVVIVMGFIFLAVGLHMLQPAQQANPLRI